MPNHRNNVSELLAPLLLEFGKAAYICQCFESSLCFLLSLMAHESADGEEGAFQASWDFHSKKTLGNLLKSLREIIEVPQDLDKFLGEGVETRNKIIHGFLTHNVPRFNEPKGRLEVEQELVALKREVKRRDIAVNKLIDSLLQKYGTSNEELKRKADRLWEHLNPEDPSDPVSSAH